QAILYPAMNATGTLAIQQAAVLDLSPGAYLLAQQHPVQLMDAIQHALRRFDRGAAGIYVAESLCDQTYLLNFNGLTAAQEAQLIALLASEPLASSHLAPLAPAVPAMQPMPAQARRFLLPTNLTGPLAWSRRWGSG